MLSNEELIERAKQGEVHGGGQRQIQLLCERLEFYEGSTRGVGGMKTTFCLSAIGISRIAKIVAIKAGSSKVYQIDPAKFVEEFQSAEVACQVADCLAGHVAGHYT